MKCEICGKGVAKTFLDKIKGTYVKDGKGKSHTVCFECQKNVGSEKDKILGKLNE